MPRFLIAGLLAVAALASGSIFLIAWSTSPEQARASAPEPAPVQAAIANLSPPPTTPDRAAPVVAVAAAPVPAARASSVTQPGPRFARAEVPATSSPRPYDAYRSLDGKPIRPRIVTSARDRHLSVTHPEILAQPRSVAVAPPVVIEDQAPPPDAPCAPGSGCDAAHDVEGAADAVPQEGVGEEASVSQ